jgi:hypothetical protein
MLPFECSGISGFKQGDGINFSEMIGTADAKLRGRTTQNREAATRRPSSERDAFRSRRFFLDSLQVSISFWYIYSACRPTHPRLTSHIARWISLSLHQSIMSSDAEPNYIDESESMKAKAEAATPHSMRSHTSSISACVPSRQPSRERRNSLACEFQVTEPLDVNYATGKRRSTRNRLYLLALATSVAGPLAIFTFYYLQEALVSDHPHLGQLFLDPSPTLTLVSVLTESLATILPLILTYLFDAMPLSSRKRNDDNLLAQGAASEVDWLCLHGMRAAFLRGTHLFSSWQRYTQYLE